MRRLGSATLTDGIVLLSASLSCDAGLIRRRCLRDPVFRALCEDYALACQSRMRLDQLGGRDVLPEMADYAIVIKELETEVAAALRAPKA
jgi:hypothetical protein